MQVNTHVLPIQQKCVFMYVCWYLIQLIFNDWVLLSSRSQSTYNSQSVWTQSIRDLFSKAERTFFTVLFLFRAIASSSAVQSVVTTHDTYVYLCACDWTWIKGVIKLPRVIYMWETGTSTISVWGRPQRNTPASRALVPKGLEQQRFDFLCLPCCHYFIIFLIT